MHNYIPTYVHVHMYKSLYTNESIRKNTHTNIYQNTNTLYIISYIHISMYTLPYIYTYILAYIHTNIFLHT